MKIKLPKRGGVQIQIVKVPRIKGDNGMNKSFTIYDTNVAEMEKLIKDAINVHIENETK